MPVFKTSVLIMRTLSATPFLIVAVLLTVRAEAHWTVHL